MRYVLFLIIAIVTQSSGQCPLDARVTKTAMRNGNNNMYGAAIAWAAGGYWWDWQAQVDGALKFQPSGGSESTIASGQNFGWLNGLGSASGIKWSTGQDLESRGEGNYRTEGSGVFIAPYCGAGGTIPTSSSPAQAVNRPERPDYQSSLFQGALMYLRDTLGTINYKAYSTLIPGAENGATGTPTWILLESGNLPGENYADLSCTVCANTVITAKESSDECLKYNIQVLTSYDGFKSEPFYIFINRPYKTLPQPVPAPGTGLYGTGYESIIPYKTQSLCSGSNFIMEGYVINEAFEGQQNPISNNWPLDAGSATIYTDTWGDTIRRSVGVYCGGASCSPAPLNPQSPLTSTLVQSAVQKWYVGSVTSGEGIHIMTNTIRAYMDHGDHVITSNPAIPTR